MQSLRSRRILVFVAVGLAAFILYLYFYVGTANFLSAVAKANGYYYTSAFAAFIVASLFAALAWMSLLRNFNVKTTVRRAFLFTWAGYFFDSTIPEPGWSGDLSKAYMLSKKSNEDVGKVAASVIGQKLISMILTVVILALGVGILALKYVLPGFVIGFLVGVFVIALVSLVVVFYVSTSPKATQKMLDLLIAIGSFILRSHWDAVCFRTRAERTLKTFHEGIGSLSANKRAFVRPVVLCGFSLAFDISVVALTFAALGSSVPIDTVLIVYALTGTIQSIGMSFVGFTEIIMSSAYNVLGVSPGLSFSVTLLARVVTLWFKLVVSYVAFQWAGLGILMDKKQKCELPESP